MSVKRRYTIRCWCDENGADGEYEYEAPSRVDAINLAVESFQEDCAMVGTMYRPPRHRVQTEVLGVRI